MIKNPRLVNQALGLESEHGLKPHMSFDQTHKFYRCSLVHKLTNVKVHEGTSVKSEEDAFFNAIQTIDIKALTASPQALSSENKDLHDQIRALESKLENEPSATNESQDEAVATDGSGDDVAPQATKVRKPRRKQKASKS